jgi:hypothetical protein
MAETIILIRCTSTADPEGLLYFIVHSITSHYTYCLLKATSSLLTTDRRYLTPLGVQQYHVSAMAMNGTKNPFLWREK